MPLIKSGSKKARQKNIEEMIESGHEPRQAVAAGYANQRKYASKGAGKMKKEHEGKKSHHHKMAEHHMGKAHKHHEHAAKHHAEAKKHMHHAKKEGIKRVEQHRKKK